MKKTLALLVVGVAVTVGLDALADKNHGAATAGSFIHHGDFTRLNDGGWRFTICGLATNPFDGGAALLDQPCVTCEPGAFAGAPAQCLAEWRAVNTN